MPAAVRAEDGDAMAHTFAALRASAPGGRTLLRVFGSLLVVIVLEWRDVLRASPGLHRRRDGMDGMWRLVRFGVRSLRRSPAFTWSVVLLLGLGVGSVTTIFTLVDHVLLRPLPYPMADRLFKVENGWQSGPLFEDLQQLGSVETWAAVTFRSSKLTGTDRPHQLLEAYVTRDFFSVFGARPALGRLPGDDDFRTGAGLVLSHRTWQRVFGGDPDVIGRTVVINDEPEAILGVLPADFTPPGAIVGETIDAWHPIDPAAGWLSERSMHVLAVAGRMRAGALLDGVQQEADALLTRLAGEFPEQYVGRDGSIRTLPMVGLQDATVGRVRLGLGLLFAAVALLLLVACLNVAHLFLSRGLTRLHEVSVRRALGAGSATILAQLLVECVLVAAGGAIFGILLAFAGLRLFLGLNPQTLPRSETIAVDTTVLAFALSVAIGTVLVFGLLPALRVLSRDASGALQPRVRGNSDGRGARRARSALVVAEVAVSLVLVTQAGSFLRSFARLHRQDPGFRTEGIWTLPLSPGGIESTEEWVRRTEAIRSSLAAAPGVQGATYGLSMPLEYTGGMRCCWSWVPSFSGIEGDETAVHPVHSDYFDLLDIRFVAGEAWQREDVNVSPRPAVLSEVHAVAVFGSAQNALGREMHLADMDFRISGVVEDNHHYGPDQDPGLAVYLPITTVPFAGGVHMAVRADRAPDGFAESLRQAVWQVEPDLPVPTVRSLEDWAGAATARMRFDSLLFTAFGAVALLLVAGGLYGTLLYTVGRRRREMGIRLALGDRPARLEGRILRHGLGIAAAGCVVGLAAAYALGRVLQSRLFAMQAGDISSTAGAVLILLFVAMLASWLPARRAAATDPMEVLRAE